MVLAVKMERNSPMPEGEGRGVGRRGKKRERENTVLPLVIGNFKKSPRLLKLK